MKYRKENYIILTGGAGGGKTSIIDELQRRGYPVAGETGRAVIRERLAQGLSPRPAPAEFARQLFQRDLDHFRQHAENTGLTFFDRSFLDSACMLFTENKPYFETIRTILADWRFNSRVFITPPWEEIFQNDSERDQAFADAVASYTILGEWYRGNGYETVDLPKTAVDERVEFILKMANYASI